VSSTAGPGMAEHAGYTRRTLGVISEARTGQRTDLRATFDLTYGGDGRKYAGSSGERGSEVETSIIVDVSS